ncbi:MAG: hypothetical protein KDD61_15660 [Bdellovibrionales bacterium]|nr:hypothetical protein [Bdellovibrionales bacterium]
MSHYLLVSQIERLQLEPTSHCNLLCPRCSRTDNGQLNSRLPLTDWQPESYEILFSQIPNRQLKEVLFNGNYGDPITSKNLLHGLEHIKNNTSASLRLHTNGSLKGTEFWKEIATYFKSDKDRLVFSIDGLDSTNALYRVNSRFPKILENAQAFIQSGGKARWDYLIFDHNRHQVDEAQKLAKKLGFIEFNAKKTARPVNLKNSQQNKGDSLEVTQSVNKYGSWSDYIARSSIDCKFRNHVRGLFVDFQFDVWPCCWLGGPLYFADASDPRRKELENLVEHYGPNFNSLAHHSLDSILNHPWMAEELVKSWQMQSPLPKLRVCTRMCGEAFEASSGANWSNSHIQSL